MRNSRAGGNDKRFLAFSFLFYSAVFVGIYPDVVFRDMSFAKRDILRFYYPVWHFSVDLMKKGVFPLWNPYNSYGTPFFADIQTCVLYPFSLLLYWPDYRLAFNVYILLHLALAGFFCCLWMRECAASRWASFLAGLSFALGGYVMSAISLTISLTSLVYFPLALLALRRAFRARGFFWKAVAALTLLVQYLGGDPAVFFATLMVVTLFVAYRTLENLLSARKLVLKHALVWASVVGVFLLLSAFHWLLFYEFLMHSNRSTPTFDAVTMWSMQYNDLVSLFFPYFSDISLAFMSYWVRQSWLENAYTGITVFFLAAAALPQIRKKPLIGYHVLLAAFGIALALGRFCPVYAGFYYAFPFFKYIRYPARFLFLFSFAAACLAGFGLDAVLARRKNERPLTDKKAVPWAAALLVLSGLVVLSMFYSAPIESRSLDFTGKLCATWLNKNSVSDDMRNLVLSVLMNAKRMAIFTGFAAFGVLASARFRPRRGYLAAYFFLLVFADLVTTNVIETRLEGRLMREPAENLSLMMKDAELFRVLASPKSKALQYEPPETPQLETTFKALKETLAPALLLPYHVADVSGYDSIFTNDAIRINDLRRRIKDPSEHRLYDMLNIKYMVSPNKEIGGAYRLIHPVFPTNLYLNERVLPRAYLVPGTRTVKARGEILEKLLEKNYDPEAFIYLDEEPPPLRQGLLSQTVNKNSVTITDYSPNRVFMEAASRSAQWLFFSDMFYPGWKALLDGKPVKIFRANYAFRAIALPPGRHRVEWKYDPILFRIGSSVSLLTALALAVYFVRRRRGQNA